MVSLESNLIPIISRRCCRYCFIFQTPRSFFKRPLIVSFLNHHRYCFFIFSNTFVIVSFFSIVSYLFHFHNRPKNFRRWRGLNLCFLSGRQRCHSPTCEDVLFEFSFKFFQWKRYFININWLSKLCDEI